jgi:Ca-activated chloride channel family protein
MNRSHQLIPAFLIVGLLGWAAEPALCQDSASEQQPIRVSVERVNVGVVVTDSSGHFADHLKREDFQVFDNGVEQPLTNFATVDEPAQVLLLIEAGPAVALLAKDHLVKASMLVEKLSADDRVALAKYDRALTLVLNFTTDKSLAEETLAGLNFTNGFSDLNLSASLASVLEWLESIPGRKTIVVLSTGVDTSAPESWQLIRKKLQVSDVRILAVSLSGDLRKPARRARIPAEDKILVKQSFAQADELLKAIAQSTGGHTHFPKSPKEFERAYAEIGEWVRHEYSLAFAAPVHDGELHTIMVKVKGMGRKVSYRQAYLAPPS